MTALRLGTAIAATLSIYLLAPTAPAHAGNECRIKYGWNTGNALNGTFQNHTDTRYLDAGETKAINKSRMNFVRNLKNAEVRFVLDNASDVTLGKEQQNPAIGTYVGNVKLVEAKCLASAGGSSSSSSPGNTSPSGPAPANNSSDCLKRFPDVVKTPVPGAPGGSVPIPYPNLNCK